MSGHPRVPATRRSHGAACTDLYGLADAARGRLEHLQRPHHGTCFRRRPYRQPRHLHRHAMVRALPRTRPSYRPLPVAGDPRLERADARLPNAARRHPPQREDERKGATARARIRASVTDTRAQRNGATEMMTTWAEQRAGLRGRADRCEGVFERRLTRPTDTEYIDTRIAYMTSYYAPPTFISYRTASTL